MLDLVSDQQAAEPCPRGSREENMPHDYRPWGVYDHGRSGVDWVIVCRRCGNSRSVKRQ